jgi:hypothetical protein
MLTPLFEEAVPKHFDVLLIEDDTDDEEEEPCA